MIPNTVHAVARSFACFEADKCKRLHRYLKSTSGLNVLRRMQRLRDEAASRGGGCPPAFTDPGIQPAKAIPGTATTAQRECAVGAREDYLDRQQEILDTANDLACLLCWDGSAFDPQCLQSIEDAKNDASDASYDQYCSDHDGCLSS